MRTPIKRLDLDPKTAWAPYQPSDANPFDLKKAGHLYRRASFGASMPELEQAVKDGPEKAISRLMSAKTPPELERHCEGMRKTIIAAGNAEQMKQLWLYRMLYSPAPFIEK